MLDDHPILKERLVALGAFVGIGVFAVAAVDVMVTGGFDFGRGRATPERQQPSAYVRAVDAADYVSDSVSSWSGTLFSRPPDTSASEERLAGADDGSAPIEDSSGDDLYDEIAALYERSEEPYVEEPSYEDAPAYDAEIAEPVYEDQGYEEPAYKSEYTDEADKIASAYETASPW